MEKNNELKLFEDKKIRTKWNEEQQKYQKAKVKEE